jgi:amino acid transporter
MSLSIIRFLIGRPVSNRESESQKLGVVAAVPAMGLDALASAAYGPEAALAVLAGTGAAGLGVISPIMLVIIVLLATLWFSYWQTILAYPNNGGSYIVAHENLGTYAGLFAAAALMIDYILNVGVGISAGVAALTSAVPALHPFTLWLCLGILLLITVVNLRGTRESGLAWAVPTYLFVSSLGVIIIFGVVETAFVGHPQPVVTPPPAQNGTNLVALWLILRAFASGCTAMTGVGAISNGVGAFREPRVRNAHATLSVIVPVLALLLLGIAHLAQVYGISAMDQTKPGYQSVISQLIGAVYGRGWFYYLTIAGALAVLCLSANTSFVGFPRMCRLVARDAFLPRAFALPGRRLVMSASILFLAICSGSLLARNHRPAHSPVRRGCLPSVHPVPGRNGRSLVARAAERRGDSRHAAFRWASQCARHASQARRQWRRRHRHRCCAGDHPGCEIHRGSLADGHCHSLHRPTPAKHPSILQSSRQRIAA